MSKEEKAKKAKEFWARLATLGGNGLSESEIEWLKEDDCYVEPRRGTLKQHMRHEAFA